MSSRKSDTTFFPADRGTSPWLITLRSNCLWPLLVAAMWPLGHLVEFSPHVNDYFARIVMLIGINIILAVSLQLINGIAGQFSLGHAGFMAVGAYMAGYPTVTYCRDFTYEPATANPTAILVFYAAVLVVLGVAVTILASIFLLIRSSRRLHWSLPGILLFLVFVWFIADIKLAYDSPSPKAYHVWWQGFALLARAFNFLIDQAQQAATTINNWIPIPARTPLTFLIALIGGGILAAFAGLVVGMPTLRLRGDYLAIATLGFAEIIRVAVVNSEALGRATGLSVPVYSIQPSPEENIPGLRIFPWIYGAVIVTTVAVWRIAHSAKGRALQAVREDEIAAAAIGIDATSHKVLAFVVGAFFAGVAGGLYAHYDGYLNPNSFGIMRSIEIVVIVTLGGLGSISGAILAAIILTILPEALRFVDEGGWWKIFIQSMMNPFWRTPPSGPAASPLYQLIADIRDFSWSQARMTIYALLLILMMLLRPRGLLGGRELWLRRRQPLPATPPITTGENPIT